MVGSLDESLPRFLCYIIFPSITFRNIHSRNIKQKKNGVSRPVLRQDGSLTPMYDKRERLTPPPKGAEFLFCLDSCGTGRGVQAGHGRGKETMP